MKKNEVQKDDIFIHPTAEVSPDAKIGKGTRIWHQVQIRERAIIGERCNIGKDVYVDFDVKIGNRVKIQNSVNIYHGVVIEDDVFVGPAVCFTNDRYPRAFISDFKVYRTVVKKGASLGANSTILCGVTIGEYALIGCGSVVTKDVPPHALVAGNPARIKGFVCTNGHKMRLYVEQGPYLVLECESCNEVVQIDKRMLLHEEVEWLRRDSHER
jgi:acetyltransferase-like isoleucine patch superfamily enzyme